MSVLIVFHRVLESPEPFTFDWWNSVAGGLGAFLLALLVAAVGVIATLHRRRVKRREEALLVTSRCRLLGGGVPWQYEITVHNATPHPLNYVVVNFWNGREWQETLAKSIRTNDPVLSPGDEGAVMVPAATTDLDRFDDFYFLTYQDSRRSTWNRLVDSPNLLSAADVRRLRNLHGVR